MNQDRAPFRTILEQAPWLRLLAHDLARNGLDADDLVQDTLVKALESTSEKRGSLRAWLAGILRNTARQAQRSEARRRLREAAAARRVDPCAPEVEGTLDRCNRLQRAVLELREPYRSTICLRYLHGLAPRQIAARESVPVRTVTTRISRALLLLRERLAGHPREEHGLFPLSLIGIATLWKRPALQHGLRAALVTLLVATSLGTVLFSGAPRSGSEVAQLELLGKRDGTPPVIAAATLHRDGARRVAASHAGLGFHGTGGTGERRLSGRVVDAQGRPRAGISVAFQPEPFDGLGFRFARSDESGRFAMDVASDSAGRAFAMDRSHVPFVVEKIPARASRDFVLVVAPRRVVRGLVRDALGNPVAGARVELQQGSRWSTRSDGPRLLPPSTETDAAGRFELANAYSMPLSFLCVTHPDHATGVLELDAIETNEARVTLQARDRVRHLQGSVLDRFGRGTQAVVTTGFAYVYSEQDGTFQIPAPWAAFEGSGVQGASESSLVRLRAAGPGWLSNELALDARESGEPLVLRLSEPEACLQGVVLDAAGQPLPGCEVWALNPTPFGISPRRLPGALGQPIFLESILAGRHGVPAPVVTDAQGAFRMQSLAQASYRLCILSPEGSALLRPPPVRPGAGPLVFELPAGPAIALAGRVHDGNGRAFEGARVTAVSAHIDVALPWNAWWFRRDVRTRETTTDAAGRFHIEGVAQGSASLTITGTDLFPANVDLGDKNLSTSLSVKVSKRARLQLRSQGAATFSLLDAQGERLPISDTSLGLFPVPGPASFRRGLKPLVCAEWSIPADAVELVVYRAGEELGRHSIYPTAGGVFFVEL